jgi:hypothetical protein
VRVENLAASVGGLFHLLSADPYEDEAYRLWAIKQQVFAVSALETN